ncbi:tetraspanin-32 isoform X1 [Ambystoma mexicanum]|uniref:tetraspanin-32 isoform X1 n=1 Tax=Ambystoma mexicanum TaxID=8296 RepID=UPI0037E7F5BB
MCKQAVWSCRDTVTGRGSEDMAEKQWVRAAKCQMLVTSAFILLLALAVGILALITHSGGQFTVISDVVRGENPYQAVYGAVLPSGICLSTILVLSAVLSTFAVMRESQVLMMMGFLCFALAFCTLVQAALWKQEHSNEFKLCKEEDQEQYERDNSEASRDELVREETEEEQEVRRVEGAVLDIYDSVYEEVRRNSSGSWRKEILDIHKTFLCCGKRSPLQRGEGFDGILCPTEDAALSSPDCLRAIEAFLRRHLGYVSGLLHLTLGFTVYGMALTSFLLFYIRLGISWERKGKYTLAQQ